MCRHRDLSATVMKHARVMAVVETIYLVAATLWILVVTAALCIGARVVVKLRRRRRRVHRLLRIALLPLEIARGAKRHGWVTR